MILGALERRWLQEPDLRLGQLLVNVTRDLRPAPSPLFYLPDAEMLQRLGVETPDERRYVEGEPSATREGWRARIEDHGSGPST
jgi:hypothetical protein